METKDFILLMIIPIILISIVSYADKPVTGFAVKEQKQEENKLGYFSVNPSFKIKIDYSLDGYRKIKEQLGFIGKCSQEGKDIEACLKDVNSQDASLKWEMDCDKGAEKALYDFSEFLQDCIDSNDNNCLCVKTLDVKEEIVQKHGLENSKYELSIGQDHEVIVEKVNDKAVNYFLTQKIDMKGTLIWMPEIYIIAYTNELFALNIIFKELSTGLTRSLGPTKGIVLYKNSNNPDKTKSIDFVRQEGSNLIYPTPGKIIQKPLDLRPCQLKPKNIYKFCVTQNNYKVIAYDKLDGQIKERNPVIRFASYVPDLPPAPLKNLEAVDRPKAEKSVLLKWDNSNEKDIVKFRIYYSDSSLKAFEKPIDDIKKNPNVVSKEIDTKAVEISSPFNLAECEFDFSNKKCLFPAEIENNKLYYSSFFNAYVYSLNVPEDKKSYDFSVTAVDKNNNEINNVDLKMPVKAAQSTDDLAPSSENLVLFNVVISYDSPTQKVRYNFGEKPKINLDGTQLNDFNNYKVYYLKYTSLTQEDKEKEIEKISNDKIKNLKFLASVNYEQQAQPFYIDLAATNPASNNFYLFVVVAADISGNPKEEQYRPKELGAKVLQLAIT